MLDVAVEFVPVPASELEPVELESVLELLSDGASTGASVVGARFDLSWTLASNCAF